MFKKRLFTPGPMSRMSVSFSADTIARLETAAQAYADEVHRPVSRADVIREAVDLFIEAAPANVYRNRKSGW